MRRLYHLLTALVLTIAFAMPVTAASSQVPDRDRHEQHHNNGNHRGNKHGHNPGHHAPGKRHHHAPTPPPPPPPPARHHHRPTPPPPPPPPAPAPLHPGVIITPGNVTIIL